MIRSVIRRAADTASKPFPRIYFDLKAFRKGISEKKQSLIQAERREIDRVYAKPAPAGWDIIRFIKETGLEPTEDGTKSSQDEKEKFYTDLASCFDDWNDFISSSRKDLFRVANLVSASQVKKLAHYIELYNHGLFPRIVAHENEALRGEEPMNETKEWSTKDDEILVDLALNKYDYTFGDPWIYIADELKRSPDSVHDRFIEIFVKPSNRKRTCEVVISKSFRPLLMNRQFRVMPPQCYIVPSEVNFSSETDGSQKFIVPPSFERFSDPSSSSSD